MAPKPKTALDDLDGEILSKLSQGLTYKQIAKLYTVTEGCIANRMFKVRDLWGTDTMPQTVAEALRRGLIT